MSRAHTRCTKKLDLRVGGEQAEAPLGRLVAGERDDAFGLSELEGGHPLACDCQLAAQLPHLPLGRLRHHRTRCENVEYLGDVRSDDGVLRANCDHLSR